MSKYMVKIQAQSSSEFHDEHCPFWLGPACGTKQTSFAPHPSWPALRISHAPSFARYLKQSAGASVAGRQLAVLPVDCIGDIFGSKNTDTCKKIGKLREAVQVLVMIFLPCSQRPKPVCLVVSLTWGLGHLRHLLGFSCVSKEELWAYSSGVKTTFSLDDGTGAPLWICNDTYGHPAGADWRTLSHGWTDYS